MFDVFNADYYIHVRVPREISFIFMSPILIMMCVLCMFLILFNYFFEFRSQCVLYVVLICHSDYVPLKGFYLS